MSGTWGYRAELRGQWRRFCWQIPASVCGAAIGAFLLLHLPERVFTRIVPVLLVAALMLVIAGPRIQAFARERALATGRSADHVNVQRMNAAKNLLSLLVNVVAAIGYTLVAFDRVSWPAAGLIEVVGLIGLYRLLRV